MLYKFSNKCLPPDHRLVSGYKKLWLCKLGTRTIINISSEVIKDCVGVAQETPSHRAKKSQIQPPHPNKKKDKSITMYIIFSLM